MKKYFLIFSILLNFIFSGKINAQTPCLNFYTAGDTTNDVLQEFCVDNNGNIYVSGWFENSIKIGNQTIQGDSFNLFVAKIDSANNLQWFKIFSTSGITYCADLNYVNGELLIGGSVYDSIHFDAFNATSIGGYDIFLAKLDAQTGNCKWLKTAGNIGADICRAITTDNRGNIYIAGIFHGYCVFDSITLTCTGAMAGYIAKYDTSGNVLWAKQVNTPNGMNILSMTLDNSSNCLISGNYATSADFGNSVTITAGSNSPFLAKYNSNGNIQWAKNGINVSGNSFYTGLTFGYSDNFYCVLARSGAYDGAIIKYDSNGDTLFSIPFLQSSSLGGNNYHNYLTLLNHKLFFANNYTSKIKIGTDSIVSVNAGQYKFFLAELDTNGLVQTIKGIEGNTCLSFNMLSLKHDNSNIYVGGNFGAYNGCYYDSSLLIMSNGMSDFFVSKYCSTLTGLTIPDQNISEVKIFPNPFNKKITISFESENNNNSAIINVLNVLGECLISSTSKSDNNSSRILNLESLSDGIYFLEIQNKKNY